MGDNRPPELRPACPECGTLLPERALHTACESCLNQRHMKVMLEREVLAWFDKPDSKVELSKGRGLSHIVLNVDSHLAYCGQRPTEPRKKRLIVRPADLDRDDKICTDCRKLFDRVRRDAQPKGVTK